MNFNAGKITLKLNGKTYAVGEINFVPGAAGAKNNDRMTIDIEDPRGENISYRAEGTTVRTDKTEVAKKLRRAGEVLSK